MLSFLSFSIFLAGAQDTSDIYDPEKEYRATPEKINDLVHTKLDARLDFPNAQLNGKVWITLKPHFYATDSLLLDAKGMEIKTVAISKASKNTPLKYKYDGMQLDIDLDRSYRGGEAYTVYIEYTAKPDEFEGQGSAAISGAKGLYFIDPKGEDPTKPTQVWTQGETEATSVYVPTIDKPNQKTTQEFILTVPAKFVTLSNGKLISHKINNDGTHTHHWKMDQPHAPYLFFLGAGEFSVIKDSYKGKEVSYYVEKEYAGVARKIFGNTPEMLKFFSSITGVEYPWVKYGQMVGRDYVSGAMENTTATLHQESAYQDERELVDGNKWEDVIAHEAFHQWFGDLVTTESWSNLTLNESFANYSEYLWREYKYGKDAADAHHVEDMQGYLMSGSQDKNLVRFHYGDKEEMFDAVSYNKGGRILHMLRNFVGDSAFFKAMNLYLVANKYKAAEAHQLRLAFEEVTGKDLNWFWNQWFFGAGHPVLDINYSYDAGTNLARVAVKQKQTGQTFKLPVKVDVWNAGKKTSYQVWVTDTTSAFYFPSATQPQLVNFDADKVLLAVKTENKSLDEYVFQYKNAGNYLDRKEAVDFAAKKLSDPKGQQLVLDALKDKYAGIRSLAISRLDMRKEATANAASAELEKIARNDPKRMVRAAAIGKLGDTKKESYKDLYMKSLTDSSYSVAGHALNALAKIDTAAAFAQAKKLAAGKTKGELAGAITGIFIKYGDESAAAFIIGSFEDMPLSQEKFEALQPLVGFLVKVRDLPTFKRGIDAIDELHMQIPEQYRGQLTPVIEGMLKSLQKKKLEAGQKELADYIDTKLKKEKGF